MKVHILGIDLAKNVFQLHGIDRKGRPVLVRRVRREQLLKVLGELEPSSFRSIGHDANAFDSGIVFDPSRIRLSLGAWV